MHLETITAVATAPGAAGAAAAAVTGDSLIIKNSKGPANIIATWSSQQADGWAQIVKPSGHDTTRGFRQVVDAANLQNLLPWGTALEVEPQELLSIQIAGSATAGDVEVLTMLVKYDDLPGVKGRFIGWPEIQKRGMWGKPTTVQATLTGTAAGYTGTELLNAESDLLWANQDYAVLGIQTSVPVPALWITGPDTAYQRCCVPGSVSEADYGRDFFALLSRAFGETLIPVINSGNKNSTFIGFTQNENNISPLVSLTLVPLK